MDDGDGHARPSPTRWPRAARTTRTRLGATAPRLLVRALECTGGEVEMAVEFAPRPEYGLVEPLLTAVEGGVMMRGGADVLVLSCPAPLAVDERDRLRHGSARAPATRMLLGLQHRTTLRAVARSAAGRRARRRAARDGRRMAGVVAAAPELPGAVAGPRAPQRPGAAGAVLPADRRGRRGRDDLAARAGGRRAQLGLPLRLGAGRELHAGGAVGRRLPGRGPPVLRLPGGQLGGPGPGGRDLQIMFGVGGEHDLTERELPHLAGWRDSRPVRVGNGAWNQRQIDVYGELLGAAHRLVAQLNPDHPGATAWREFLVACADAAARRWREKDQGIWEVRGEPRHFLYSKLMCWVGARPGRRARRHAARHGPGRRLAGRGRRDPRPRSSPRAGDDTAKSFTQSFGSADLDASNLMIAIVGFLPPDDPRVVATIDAVAERLTDARGLVYRYRTESGRTPTASRARRARSCSAPSGWPRRWPRPGRSPGPATVFERAVRYVNDVGLLAEEVDPATGDLLGNFPQAFSHIGLVNAAWAIARAEEATPRPRANF